jgi:hypothetical protein
MLRDCWPGYFELVGDIAGGELMARNKLEDPAAMRLSDGADGSFHAVIVSRFLRKEQLTKASERIQR